MLGFLSAKEPLGPAAVVLVEVAVVAVAVVTMVEVMAVVEEPR